MSCTSITKAVFDNLDEFKKLHPAFAALDPSTMVKDGLSAPLHHAAVRYYKEKGWYQSDDPRRRRRHAGPGSRSRRAHARCGADAPRAGVDVPRLVAAAAVVRVAAAVHVQRLRAQLDRDARAASRLRVVSRLLAFPFAKRSPRDRIPLQDWVLAAAWRRSAARTCSCSIARLSTRPAQPTPLDIATAVIGMLLLLEATRRVVGPPLAIIAVLMLGYAFAGPYMPDVDRAQGRFAGARRCRTTG